MKFLVDAYSSAPPAKQGRLLELMGIAASSKEKLNALVRMHNTAQMIADAANPRLDKFLTMAQGMT